VGAIQSASDYTRLGWPVLPVHSIENGICTCRKGAACPSPGKHPRTRNGVNDATTQTETISRWHRDWPTANIGIATGKTSGILVLDIDVKTNGFESLARLSEKYGPSITDTLTADTGGGGLHLIYKSPEQAVKTVAGQLAPGIDTRSCGGYVVGPPSIHMSGKTYTWRNGIYEPARIPDALLGAILKSQSKKSTSTGTALPSVIKEGERNNMLFRFAASLRGQGLERDDIERRLLEENQFRCKPPLPKEEILRIASSAAKYGKGSMGLPNLYLQEILNNPLSSSSKLILHTLLSHADNDTLNAFPSQETIAKESGLSRPTVGSHIKILKNLGWIDIARKGRVSSGHGWRYEYTLTFPP
jgi:putative DNA primase/helicase